MTRAPAFPRLVLGIVLAGALALAGCDQTPTGRSQLTLVPAAIMTEMGEEAFAQMKRQQPLAGDPARRARVACVAQAIIAAAKRQYPEADLPASWDIAVFDNPVPNAFALPGGNIGVHTGILKVAQTPAQLAAILGHEVAHLLANHGNERLTQQLGIKAGMLVAGLLVDVESEQIMQALGLGALLGITLPFSRAHESEADLMGLKLMATAGFPPEQSVALWRNMAEASSGQPIEFLSTHPANATRIEDLQQHLPAARQLFAQAPRADCRG